MLNSLKLAQSQWKLSSFLSNKVNLRLTIIAKTKLVKILLYFR